MKKIILLFVVLLVVTFQFTTPAYADNILNDAPSYILIDAKSGTVLDEKNAGNRMFPASTTKILTAVLAIEKGKMDQIMTASKEAVYDIGHDGMNIGIGTGEQLRMEDLLNAMLIQSANETANIVAENIAPSRKDFVDMMNARAKELGATNTHFTNPCGMHDNNHYTSAHDLAVIARYALTLPQFREIVIKKSYNMSPTNMHTKWDTLYTTNRLLYYSSDYFTEVTGVKSGYTGEAGYTLVSSARNAAGQELIAVVMGERSHSKYKIVTDSKLLLEHGFKDYSIQKLADAGQTVENLWVGGPKEKVRLALVTDNEFSCLLPIDKNDWNLSTIENIKHDIKLPVRKGQVLGNIEYERNGSLLGKVNVIAATSVGEKIPVKSKNPVKHVKGKPILLTLFKLLIGIILFFLALRLVLRTVSRNLKAKKKMQHKHLS